MNDTFEKRLIECLDALEQGESLDAILARYPESAVELRPLLETAVSLQTLKIQPTVAAQQRSKTQFLQTAVTLREKKATPPFWLRLQRLLLPAAGLVVLLILLSATLIPASAQAVPGDTLYSTKRFIEETRLRLTNNADKKLKLVETYDQKRIAEINTLLAEGQQANVSFHGPIQAIGEQTWTIAGLTTWLAADVIIEGAPEIGLTAMVTGQTKDGELVALMIFVPDGGKPLPIVPTPTPSTTPSAIPSATKTISSPTASPTATQTATATSSPTSSPTLTATPSPSPTATATLKPTETAVPPTSSPTPPANDNDNTNDNDNENTNGNENDNINDNDNTDDNDNTNGNENDNTNDNSTDEANENDGT